MAAAEFSEFAGILSAALSQHHLSGFGIAQLEFHQITDLIIYAERAGITVTNYDGTKTLFTTTDAQSAWHVYAADVNGYFSPSGYVVEKITLQ